MKTPTAQDITQECKTAVSAYLLARTLFECERDKVDEIQQNILDSCVFNYAEEWKSERRGLSGRITSLKDTYLMSDTDHHDYLEFVRADLVKAGYVIEDIPGEPIYSYKCPALSAESLKRDAEHLIIDAFASALKFGDDFGHKLICSGLEAYHKFIDLCVGMVVNMDDFKNPLTGKVIA